jgi:tRNA pseudouridine55 synthase
LRILTDQEVGDLRQGQTILPGAILPPDWPLPAGFPDPQAPIRGFHLDRLAFLLKLEQSRLQTVTALPGGL